MVGWHHRLEGNEFEQALGDGEKQGSLACCSPWGHKELDMTERLNSNSAHSKYPHLSQAHLLNRRTRSPEQKKRLGLFQDFILSSKFGISKILI